PLADRERFTDWTAQAIHLLNAPLLRPEQLQRSLAAARALQDYFQVLIDERRRAPREDMLTDLVRATDEGDRLTPQELLTQSTGLLIAGFETPIGLIGNGILQLASHPGEYQKLRDNPGLVGSAVEECLRYDGPILFTLRVLREDTRFGDFTIPADREVLAIL